jgi:hypothetical protein
MAVTPAASVNGLIYVSGTVLEGANAWTVDIDHRTAEYIKHGDLWVNNVHSINAFSATIGAVHDQDTKQLATAAVATVSVATLIYPLRTDLTTFLNFSGLYSMGYSADVGNVVMQTANILGTGTLTLTGFA